MTTAAPKASRAMPAPRPAKTPTVKTSSKVPAKSRKPAAVVQTAKIVTATKAKPLAKSVPAKADKLKKPKMVRDSFTIPKPEFAVLDVLKARAAKLSHPTKKTELIRAGIKALAAMSDAAFLAAVKSVPNLKTGRPAKS